MTNNTSENPNNETPLESWKESGDVAEGDAS